MCVSQSAASCGVATAAVSPDPGVCGATLVEPVAGDRGDAFVASASGEAGGAAFVASASGEAGGAAAGSVTGSGSGGMGSAAATGSGTGSVAASAGAVTGSTTGSVTDGCSTGAGAGGSVSRGAAGSAGGGGGPNRTPPWRAPVGSQGTGTGLDYRVLIALGLALYSFFRVHGLHAHLGPLLVGGQRAHGPRRQ